MDAKFLWCFRTILHLYLKLLWWRRDCLDASEHFPFSAWPASVDGMCLRACTSVQICIDVCVDIRIYRRALMPRWIATPLSSSVQSCFCRFSMSQSRICTHTHSWTRIRVDSDRRISACTHSWFTPSDMMLIHHLIIRCLLSFFVM